MDKEGLNMSLWETRKFLRDHIARCQEIIECIDYVEQISKEKNCNDCLKHFERTCDCEPAWGEPVRINCPLWESKDGKVH